MQFPIRVKRQATFVLPATTTSANVQWGETGSTGPRQLRVVNDSTGTVFLAFGNAGVVAVIPVAGALTSGSYNSPTAGTKPVLAGATEVFTAGGIWAAAIMGTGTGTVYLSECDGF